MAVARTGVYLGKWAGKTWTFNELDEQRADQEPAVDLMANLTVGPLMGEGAFGKVFQCKIRTYDGADKLAIKLPLKLLELGWLKISDATLHFMTIDEIRAIPPKNRIRAAVLKARKAFLIETVNFENIYETPYQAKNFGHGRRAVNANLQTMRLELRALEMHPGRKHIHRILHLNEHIPAIISERCDGSLSMLRANRPHMFSCMPNLSDTWRKVGVELGSAIDYIGNRQMVHTDIKPGNVFFVWENGQPLVKLGDFGLCRRKTGPVFYGSPNWFSLPCGTPAYTPKNWPSPRIFENNGRILDPEVLSHVEFAITMLRMLFVPEAPDWPTGHIEQALDLADTLDWGTIFESAENLWIRYLIVLLNNWQLYDSAQSLALLKGFVKLGS